MHTFTRKGMLRLAALAVVAVTHAATSEAGVIQPTVILPPLDGSYAFGGICVSALGRCTQNATVSNFAIVSSAVVGGDQVVDVTATYSADIHMEVGGLPGALVGHLSIPGTAQFRFVGRDPSINPLGTFSTELTAFGFAGLFNGNTFEVQRNASSVSGGSTTILQASVSPVTYEVDGVIDIYALYSFNGAPFVAAPPRTGELGPTVNPVPEPATTLLAGAALACLGLARRRRVKQH